MEILFFSSVSVVRSIILIEYLYSYWNKLILVNKYIWFLIMAANPLEWNSIRIYIVEAIKLLGSILENIRSWLSPLNLGNRLNHVKNRNKNEVKIMREKWQ